MMRIFPDIEALRLAIGEELGISDWVTVDQARIDRFAEATGDHQWIHVDIERARASPLGTTIAHGFLTLSLMAGLSQSTYRVDKVRNRLNYGCNRVRFMTPVPAGCRVRGRFKAVSLEDVPQGVRLTTDSTIELEGSAKPACVAEQISILIPA
jgi:acyl dehydratase